MCAQLIWIVCFVALTAGRSFVSHSADRPRMCRFILVFGMHFVCVVVAARCVLFFSRYKSTEVGCCYCYRLSMFVVTLVSCDICHSLHIANEKFNFHRLAISSRLVYWFCDFCCCSFIFFLNVMISIFLRFILSILSDTDQFSLLFCIPFIFCAVRLCVCVYFIYFACDDPNFRYTHSLILFGQSISM